MPIASLISGAAGLASGILGYENSNSLNQDQQFFNERMWRLNNEYNTPVNQMKRLRQAGINPHFAISGGSLVTGNSSSPPASISPVGYDFSPLSEAASRSAELYQQKLVNDADIGLKNAQAENQRIRNITQLYRDYAELLKTMSETDLNKAEYQVAQAQASELWTNIQSLAQRNESEIERTESETRLNDALTEKAQSETAYQEVLNSFAPAQQALITKQLQAKIKEIYSAAYKNDKEAALALANQALSAAQAQGVQIDAQTKAAMAHYIVEEQFAKAQEAKYRAGNQYKQYEGGYVGTAMPVGGNARRSVGSSPVGSSRRKPSSSHSSVR